MNYYFVFLRRPKNLDDKRYDPFWEFGSFGRTGCHSRNLLHPVRTPLRKGDRLVFIQGGNQELRIVGLTPPIQVAGTATRLELLWDADYRPLPYSNAPLLVDNCGITDFDEVLILLKDARRNTFCGKASSRFRSCTTPIAEKLVEQIDGRLSQGGLPESKFYIDAIQAPNERWHQEASRKRWALPAGRRRDYESLDSLKEKQSGNSCATQAHLKGKTGSS